MESSFIGSGWAFPIRADATGRFALVSGDRELEESIYLILRTSRGERPMRPAFGCGIHDYVFAPADATTAGALAFEVRLALDRWEPRIDVIDVSVNVDADREGSLLIDVLYTPRERYDPRNLVFPFYVIPDEVSQ